MAEPANPTRQAASAPRSADSIQASTAAWLGAALIAVGLLGFVGTLRFTSSSAPSSLAFAAMSGVALLSLTLVGVMVLARAIGVTDATQALGLPQGSVRALLAFALAIVFVAVSSWTLGGLFDPTGPLVATDTAAAADLDAFLKPYQTDRYIIFKTASADKVAAEVYLRREAPEKDVVDIAKQIVTISATVLVTIVGFYFGAKSSTDATKSANDSLVAMRKAINDASDDTSDDASPADIAKTASAVGAIATATAAKLQSLGAAPMEALREPVQHGRGGDAAKTALASAEASYATLADRAKITQDAGVKAAQLAAGAGSLAQAGLNSASAQLNAVMDSASQANQDFEHAYAAFDAARKKLLAAVAS